MKVDVEFVEELEDVFDFRHPNVEKDTLVREFGDDDSEPVVEEQEVFDVSRG